MPGRRFLVVLSGRDGIEQFVVLDGFAGSGDRRQGDACERDRQLGRTRHGEQPEHDRTGRHPPLPAVAENDGRRGGRNRRDDDERRQFRAGRGRPVSAGSGTSPQRRPRRVAAARTRRLRAAVEWPARRRPRSPGRPRPAGSPKGVHSGRPLAQLPASRRIPSTPSPAATASCARCPTTQHRERGDGHHDRDRHCDKAIQRRAVELRRFVEHRDRVDDVLDKRPVAFRATYRHQGEQRSVDHTGVVE